MKKALLVAAAVCAVGCGGGANDVSELDSLSFDLKATNRALIIGVPGEPTAADYLGATLHSTAKMEALYGRAELGFKTSRLMQKSKQDILAAIATAAAEVSTTGTLVIYYDGHGAEDGQLTTATEMFSYRDIAAAVMSRRTAPLKRFIMTADTCYGGNLVNGQNSVFDLTDQQSKASTLPPAFTSALTSMAIQALAVGLTQKPSTNTTPPAAPSLASILQIFLPKPPGGTTPVQPPTQPPVQPPTQLVGKAYEQVIVMASVSKTETAQALAGTAGGYTNVGFEAGLAAADKAKATFTIKEFLDTIRTTIETESPKTGNAQHPQYRFLPESIGTEKLY